MNRLDHNRLASVKPLFRRTLEASHPHAYLANHSLGRMPESVNESLADFAASWADHLDESWSDDRWIGQALRFRNLLAQFVGVPSAENIVPKSSAGQGLRAVLNAFPPDRTINVVTTTGEFDSIDFILKAYAEKGRVSVRWVGPSADHQGVPLYESSAVAQAITEETDLVIVSSVYFTTGQVLDGIESLVARAHSCGARVMVDSYHALGAMPFSLQELGADFAIGGCYKYLRGGPGAGFLALAPHILDDEAWKTLDTGWFAKKNMFGYERTNLAERGHGGQAWMESTPPVVTAYQAVPGLQFVHDLGVAAVRHDTLAALAEWRENMRSHGLKVIEPGEGHAFGNFGLWPHPAPATAADRLRVLGVITDARGGYVRFGPDIFNTSEDLARAATAAAEVGA
jgi:kynureninase